MKRISLPFYLKECYNNDRRGTTCENTFAAE